MMLGSYPNKQLKKPMKFIDSDCWKNFETVLNNCNTILIIQP